jgi:hypothetical protein
MFGRRREKYHAVPRLGWLDFGFINHAGLHFIVIDSDHSDRVVPVVPEVTEHRLV